MRPPARREKGPFLDGKILASYGNLTLSASHLSRSLAMHCLWNPAICRHAQHEVSNFVLTHNLLIVILVDPKSKSKFLFLSKTDGSLQVFPYETFDGMFEKLAERGYSDQQYQAVSDSGLVEYHEKMMDHRAPGESPDWDTFGWLELTPEGQKILDTYQKEEENKNESPNTSH